MTGTRIRERRLMLGVRQAELARSVGISASYLNLIEHNRRRIGGKLLIDIGRALNVDAATLAEGADAAISSALRDAAAQHESARADLSRIEEFASRFPGWARLLADRQRRVTELERVVEMLSDRLTHDPFLSASLHEVLSTITAIRSTAGILAETEDLDPEWHSRFLRNLRDDSRRLAEGAQALVGYLDDSADVVGRQSLPQEELEDFLDARAYHVAELEEGRDDIDNLIAAADMLVTASGRDLARRYLARYARDAACLPMAPLVAAVARHGLDPAALAQDFGLDPTLVFRRLAALPAERGGADVGLVICDGSGTLTFRKPVAGFALPRFGAACPLWPLYQALSRPMAPIRTTVELSGRPARRFLAYAICQPVAGNGFDSPQVFESSMLILPEPGEDSAPAQPIGTACRICPRPACPARREASILADGFQVGMPAPG